jgi:hypothetical protein
MAFYFFTEPTSMADQTLPQEAFGPQQVAGSLETHFQATSIHKANGKDPLAYAVCNGLIRYQADEKNALLLTAVLRPCQRIIEGLPIVYFIYRGILKSSIAPNANGDLIGVVVPPATHNSVNVTDRVHYFQQKINQRNGTAVVPNIQQLGAGFTAAAAAPFTRADNDTINSIFFENTVIKAVNVDRGMILGKFHRDFFGFEIVLDGVLNEPRMFDLRKISVQPDPVNDNLPGNIIKATDADESVNKLRREKVLYYLDPCAFYGIQYNSGVLVKDELGAESTIREGGLVTTVLNKFLNRNNVYIDIRNENGLSFNYYNSNPAQILFSANETTLNRRSADNVLLRTAPAPVNYETNRWPLKIIKKEDAVVKPGSSQTGLRMALPIGEAITADTQRIVYLNYSIFYYNAAQVQRNPVFDSKMRFQDLIIRGSAGADTYTPDLTLTSPANNFQEAGSPVLRPVCFYHKLMYVKQHAAAVVANSPVVATYKNFDNLFVVKNVENYIKWTTGVNSSQYFLTGQEKYLFNELGFYEGVVQTGVAIDTKGTSINEKRITFFHILVNERTPGHPPAKTKFFVESALNNGFSSVTNPVPVQYDSFFSSYHTGKRNNGKLDLILTKKVIDLTPANATPASRVFLQYAQNVGNGAADLPYSMNAVKCISMSFEEYERIIQLRNTNGYDIAYHPVFIQQKTITPVAATATTIAYNTVALKLAGLFRQGASYINREVDVPVADVPALQSIDNNLFCTQAAALFEPAPIENYQAGFDFYGSLGKADAAYVAEERQFLRALDDIKVYNPEFYGALQRAFIFGNRVYFHDNPDVPVMQRTIIYVALPALGAGEGGETGLQRSADFVGLPAAVTGGRHVGAYPGAPATAGFDSVNPNRLRLGGTEGIFRPSRLKDDALPDEITNQFVSVTAYKDLNVNNAINPTQLDKLYTPAIQVTKINDDVMPGFLRGRPYDTKYDNNPMITYEEGVRLGVGTTTGSIFIKINNSYKAESDVANPQCAFYSPLRTTLLQYLSHELGHALALAEAPLRVYLWDELELFYNGSSDSNALYIAASPRLQKIPDEISITPTKNPASVTINGVATVPAANTFTGSAAYDATLGLAAAGFKTKFGNGHLRGNISGTYSALSHLITHLNYGNAVNDAFMARRGAAGPHEPSVMPKCGYLYYNLDIKAYYSALPHTPANIVNEYESLSKYSK